MQLLDRSLQRRILETLAAAYPRPLAFEQLQLDTDETAWSVNAQYLAEHLLIEAQTADFLDQPAQVTEARITARGLDFLQDDGGLGAVLNVMTVRLDAETLRALMQERIDAAPIDESLKTKLTTWVKTASSEALKEATQRLVGAALDHAPDALRLLNTALG